MDPSDPPKPKRKSPAGVPTTDLVLSAMQGTNADLFPRALALYVEPGATVADTTYGKGVFWRNVPEGRYDLRATDLQTGVDARSLPYADASMDAVVFDPPWMPASSGRTMESSEDTRAFESYYRNNARPDGTLRYRDAVLALYEEAAREALRVLRPKGVYFVKCQDEVHANRQYLTHCELWVRLGAMGFLTEDLFVLVRWGKPGVSRLLRQAHARKNHSYLMVFRKKVPASR